MKNLILSGKKALISLMLAGVITSGSLLNLIIAKVNAGLDNHVHQPNLSLAIMQQNSLMASSSPDTKLEIRAKLEAKEKEKVKAKTIIMTVTAYSSTPEETDDTPFITASGKYVADGIVANNFLPFGTKVAIPELYGDKVFIVQDRMNKRMGDYRLDIWFPTKMEAKIFGVETTKIEILEN